MLKRSNAASIIICLIFCVIIFFAAILIVKADAKAASTISRIIHVASDFGTIQSAVNNAQAGETVQVSAGIYYEHVAINKSISLVGDAGSIIDGNYSRKIMFQINADNVNISGFKFQNSGYGWNVNGIYVYHSTGCRIENNTFSNVCHNIRLNDSRNCEIAGNTINGTMYGIRVINSTGCTVATNRISGCVGAVHLENATGCTIDRNVLCNNPGQGIRLYTPCTGNLITENTACNNSYAGMIALMPGNNTYSNNTIVHNNFVNNTNSFIIQCNGTLWDNGYEGNYWSNYNGIDANQDGIGDTPYNLVIGKDRYPLMGSFSAFDFKSEDKTYTATIITNTNVTEFSYTATKNSSEFRFKTQTLTPKSNRSFCRVTLPSELFQQPFALNIDGQLVQSSVLVILSSTSDTTKTSFYFTFENGHHEIELASGYPTPEYGIFFILIASVACIVAATLVLLFLRKKSRTKRTK